MTIAGRLLVSLEAETSQFQARMSASGEVLQRLESSGASAHRGVTIARRGLEELAVQATGVEGVIGRVASGLLTLGAVSTTTLAVLGMAGVVVGAFRIVAQTLDEVNAAALRGQTAFAALAGQGNQLVTVMSQFIDLQAKLEAAQEKLGANLGMAAVLRTLPLMGGVADLLEARGTGAAAEAGGLTNALDVAARRRGEAKTDVLLEGFLRDLQQGLLLKPPALGGVALPGITGVSGIPGPAPFDPRAAAGAYLAAGAAADQAARFKTEMEQFTTLFKQGLTPAQQYKIASAALLDLYRSGKISTQEFDTALVGLNNAMKQAAKTAQISAAQMVTAFAGVIAALTSRGGVGGVLAGIGGVVGLFNPLAGAIVAGVGTVIASAQSRHETAADQRNQALIDVLEKKGPGLIVLERGLNQGDVRDLDALAAAIQQLSDRGVITVREGL